MVRGTEVVTFLLAGSFSASDADFLYGQHLHLSSFHSPAAWVVLLCGFTLIKFREVAVRRPGKLQHSTVSCFYRVQYAFVNRLSVKTAQPHFFLTYSATPRPPPRSSGRSWRDSLFTESYAIPSLTLIQPLPSHLKANSKTYFRLPTAKWQT